MHLTIQKQNGRPKSTPLMSRDGSVWYLKSSSCPQIAKGSNTLYICGDSLKDYFASFAEHNHASAVELGFLIEDLLRQLNIGVAEGNIELMANTVYEFN